MIPTEFTTNKIDGSTKQYKFANSLLEFGGVADRLVDNTSLVQEIIDSMVSGWILIEGSCRWNENAITKKFGVHIYDMSGYNPKTNQWGGQVKYLMHTDNPATKNAHELIIKGWHHPAMIVDCTGGSSATRASVIFRVQDVSLWRLGMGISDTDTNFVISSKASSSLAQTGRLYIDKDSDSFGFNATIEPGVSYNFGNRTWTQHIVNKYTARTNFGTQFHFYSGTTSPVKVSQVSYNSDGSVAWQQNGKSTLMLDANGGMYGFRSSPLNRTFSSIVTMAQSGRVIHNAGSTSTGNHTLPPATIGLGYRFVVATEANLNVVTSETDVYRGISSKLIGSLVPGSVLEIMCLVDGTWDILSMRGQWKDQEGNIIT